MRRILLTLLPACLLLSGCGAVSAVGSVAGAAASVTGAAVDVVTSPF